MKAIFPVTLLAVFTVCFMPAAAMADQVDNPQFAAWSKCAVGSSASYQQTEAGAQATVDIKKTLKEKADDHVTLETSQRLHGAADVPPQITAEKIPAKLDKAPNENPLPNETLQIGAKKIDCKVSELDSKAPTGEDIKVKFWTSDEVPGGLVKMEASQGTQVVATLQVKEFDKK